MNTRINAVDNDRYYANGSIFKNNTEEEPVMITRKKNMYTTATRGKVVLEDGSIQDVYYREHHEPKYEGGHMEYVNAFGEEYFDTSYMYDHEDEETGYHDQTARDTFVILTNIIENEELVDVREDMELPEGKVPMPKRTRYKKAGNEAWRWRKYKEMKHTLPTLDLDKDSVYQNSGMSMERFVDEMETEDVWDVAQKVDGGVSKEEISFLGMNCSSARSCTFAWGLAHNPKWLLKKCKELSNRTWMTPELKDYLWELLKAALDETWKEELEKALNKGKHVHIDIYPPTPKMKEGFINIKAKIDGNTVKTKRICFLKEESQIKRTYASLGHIEESSKNKGYTIHKKYMDPAKVSYRKARSEFQTKSNNPKPQVTKKTDTNKRIRATLDGRYECRSNVYFGQTYWG